MSKYNIFTSLIDNWAESEFNHISQLSDHMEDFIRDNPRSNFTFNEVWRELVDKIYFAFTHKEIDFPLRSNDLWYGFCANKQMDSFRILLAFKVNNNGTTYLIADADMGDKIKLKTEYGDEWELVKEKVRITRG
jgi:hypothetical protein